MKTKTGKHKNAGSPERDEKSIVLLGDMPRYQGARNYRAYVLIAGKGFGKTTQATDDANIYLKKWENAYEPPMGPRVIIQDYNGAFKDVPTIQEFIAKYECAIGKKMKYEHPLEMLKWVDKQGWPIWKNGKLRFISNSKKEIELFHNTVFNHVVNAFVIMDECSNYMYGNLSDWQKKILYNHRNRGLEVLYIYHLIQRIPREFCQGDAIHSFRIGKTGEATNEHYRRLILNRYGISEKVWDAHVKATNLPKRLTSDGQEARVQHFVEVTL